MTRIAALALAALFAGTGGLRAESAFDLVFRSGTLDGLPQGTELRYDAEEASEPGDGPRQVVVGLGPDGSARVERRGAGAEASAEPLGSFRATVGNPVAMVFLEGTVADIAAATGGSPFYIRNRIRDALAAPVEGEALTVSWEGAEVEATEVALLPFAEDARRAELGAFADLAIRVVVSDEVPGWYHSIRAEAPAAGAAPTYAASLMLSEVEE